MNDSPKCPKCGSALSPGIALGLCPTCLFQTGVNPTAADLRDTAAATPGEALTQPVASRVDEGRAQYADPCSIIRAAGMLLDHIGYPEKAKQLQMALDVCGDYEKKLVLTGRDTGATGAEYAQYVMDTLSDPKLQEKYEGYFNA